MIKKLYSGLIVMFVLSLLNLGLPVQAATFKIYDVTSEAGIYEGAEREFWVMLYWKTDMEALDATIEYCEGTTTCTDPEIDRFSSIGEEHSWRISGLKNNTQYAYKLTVRGRDNTYVSYPAEKDWATVISYNAPRQAKTLNGDGEYDLIANDKVKLNNGVTLEPKHYYQSQSSKGDCENCVVTTKISVLQFDVYDKEGKKLGSTGNANQNSGVRNYVFGDYKFTVEIKALAVESGNWRAKAVFNSTARTEDDHIEVEPEYHQEKEELPKLISVGPIETKIKETIKSSGYEVSTQERNTVTAEKNATASISQTLTNRLAGRILLQVENHGEAWYVDKDIDKRFYLRNGTTAYVALRAFGLGATNENINKIPIGITGVVSTLPDTDRDGLDDYLEESIGTDKNNADTDGDGFGDGIEVKNDYNPLGDGKLTADTNLANNLKGEILLQVEDKGQAWYINPEDGRRYYMQNGDMAYEIMRKLSLGISNTDIRKIEVGELD